MIGIPRNGFNTRRSLSPVTMRSALPSKASANNLSSLGSRQIWRSVCTEISSSTTCMYCRKSRRRSVVLYLSNFERVRTSSSSCHVSREASTVAVRSAFATASAGVEDLAIEVLTNMFVSITTLRIFALKISLQLFELFRSRDGLHVFPQIHHGLDRALSARFANTFILSGRNEDRHGLAFLLDEQGLFSHDLQQIRSGINEFFLRDSARH